MAATERPFTRAQGNGMSSFSARGIVLFSWVVIWQLLLPISVSAQTEEDAINAVYNASNVVSNADMTWSQANTELGAAITLESYWYGELYSAGMAPWQYAIANDISQEAANAISSASIFLNDPNQDTAIVLLGEAEFRLAQAQTALSNSDWSTAISEAALAEDAADLSYEVSSSVLTDLVPIILDCAEDLYWCYYAWFEVP